MYLEESEGVMKEAKEEGLLENERIVPFGEPRSNICVHSVDVSLVDGHTPLC